jgi:predicted alpha/beta hydrolase
MAVLIKFHSIKVNVPSHKQSGHEEIRLTRFYTDKNTSGMPVLMVHDIAQDGRTFYTHDGEGLACALAKQGYDVYVADLRGRGDGWPLTSSNSAFGFHHWITQDIPACAAAIEKKRGSVSQVWLGHGWGGVMLAAAYARYADQFAVEKLVCFGSCRTSQRPSWQQRLWQKLATSLVRVHGFLPAKPWRLARCDESVQVLKDQQQWRQVTGWIDPVDDFDYSAAAKRQTFPPSFYFAAEHDSFSRPDDVRTFMQALGVHDGRMMVLSREGGNLHNYNHMNMLLHEDCEQDHFQTLLDWLNDEQFEMGCAN